MKRRTPILVAGLALMAGLYLYDRDNRTDTVLPATVLSLEDQDNEAGPDSWHLVVQIDGTEVTLEPLEKRPNLGPGDAVCVTRIERAGQQDEHRLTPSANC